MNDRHVYIINVAKLFDALNDKRKKNALDEIDNPLIASKLGILFALKTNGYVNFKGESVQLNDSQLIALQEILDQHFNVEMTAEIRHLVTTEEQWQKEMATNISQLTVPTTASASLPKEGGIFNKIKGLFRNRTPLQRQESHA